MYRIQLRKRRRWATQPALTANAPRSPCEGTAKVLMKALQRRCEGSCHAFLLPVPRRWATQPALTANAPRSPCEGTAKVAAMPSCCPCLVDGRHNLLSLRTPLRRRCERLAKLLQTLSTSPQNLNSGLNSHGYITIKSRVSCGFSQIVTGMSQ